MARTRELDRWARVLAVSNDGDAVAELKTLRDKLKYMVVWAVKVEVSLRRAPDPELLALARQAVQEALALWAALYVVQRKFEAHERGGR